MKRIRQIQMTAAADQELPQVSTNNSENNQEKPTMISSREGIIMKTPHIKSLRTLICMLLVISMTFFRCEHQGPLSADMSDTETSVQGHQPKFLKLYDAHMTLDKKKKTAELITVLNGGTLELYHGSATNMVYGTRAFAQEIYQIDLNNPGSSTIVGTLDFRAEAIATHPNSGRIYYLGRIGAAVNGLYEHKIGVWDPQDGSNSVLPQTTWIGQGVKMTFDPDGNLYGAHHTSSTELFTIDTSSGSWNLLGNVDIELSGSGDLAFSPDGDLYNLNGHAQKLEIIDLNTLTVQTVATAGNTSLTGMGFAKNGRAFVSKVNGAIYELNLSTGATSYVGTTGLMYLCNLSTLTGRNELSYSSTTLEILPGALSENKEIEIEIETTELSGGVALTFSPHGTIFNMPAILNIEAHGVDFTGVNPDDIDIFYDNEVTGQWELMPREAVEVDVINGTVKVINALLPHFSRYGVAAD